jgi:hypothetical protein
LATNPGLARTPAAPARNTGGAVDPDATHISGTGLPFPSAPLRDAVHDDDATVITGITTPPGKRPGENS